MKYLKLFESHLPIWYENISSTAPSAFANMTSMEKTTVDYLVGKVVDDIVINSSMDEVVFYLEDGDTVVFYHEQDCCEGFVLEDVEGDFLEIINTRILLAEERISVDNPSDRYNDDSNTWTFYTIRTLRGTVVMRFCGSSNGYYSERCDIALIRK